MEKPEKLLALPIVPYCNCTPHRPLGSSFWGIPYRTLNINHNKELLGAFGYGIIAPKTLCSNYPRPGKLWQLRLRQGSSKTAILGVQQVVSDREPVTLGSERSQGVAEVGWRFWSLGFKVIFVEMRGP